MNAFVCRVFMGLSSFLYSSHGYCSSSPASEKAPFVSPTDAPQTTLVAEAVPVLEPQTTLNALRVLSLQGSELPQTTEEPQTTELPQTTEEPQTTELPHTTDVVATLELPYTSET